MATIGGYFLKRQAMLKLLGSECRRCGSTQKLEFHHVDRTLKEFEVSRKWNISLEKLRPEIMKCELLCQECHKKEHQKKPHLKDLKKSLLIDNPTQGSPRQ